MDMIRERIKAILENVSGAGLANIRSELELYHPTIITTTKDGTKFFDIPLRRPNLKHVMMVRLSGTNYKAYVRDDATATIPPNDRGGFSFESANVQEIIDAVKEYMNNESPRRPS